MNLDPVILAELQRGGPPVWASGRTYRAGQCVQSPIDWQVYMRATNGAGTDDPKNDGGNWVRWGAAIEAAVALVSAAVTNVNTAVGNVNTAVGSVSGKADAIQTTVNAMNAAKGIKSVQRGVTTPPAPTGGGTYVSPVVVTISAVVPAKTTLSLLSVVTQGPMNSTGFGTKQQLRLLSATQLEVISESNIQYGSGGIPCSWEAIEWY